MNISQTLTTVIFVTLCASTNGEGKIFINPDTQMELIEYSEVVKNISGLGHFEYTGNFDTIHIKCTSKYPNKWTFASNPLSDSSSTFYIDKARFAQDISNRTTFTYVSDVVFQLQNPFITQTVKCEHSDKYKSKDYYLATYIALSRERDEDALRIIISINKTLQHKVVHPRFGNNENCKLVLHVDKQTRRFSCQYKGQPNVLRVRFVPCNEVDECAAMFVMDQCPNSVVDSCLDTEIEPCKTFPENTPVVIICEGSLHGKTSIARRIFPTIESPPTYYMNESEVNISQVLKLNLSNTSTIYQGDLIHVDCTGASAFFTKGFRWGLQSPNESIEYVPLNETSETFSTGIYYTAQLEVRLYTVGIKKIICFAPVINSYNFPTVSIRIKIEEIPPPELDGINYETKTVTKGAYVKFTCQLTQADVPPVKFVWFQNGKPLVSECTSRSRTEESCHIESKEESVRGRGAWTSLTVFYSRENINYTCNATNKYGVFRSRNFQVHVIPSSGYNAYYTQIVVPTALIVILLIAVVGLNNYFLKKKNHRHLNDDELAEFGKGKEEPFGLESGPYKDPYSLAYNKEYEISRSGFTIEKGKSGFLGRGAYGLVQKGKCVQGNTVVDVAVKTVKPSVDVVYFMALLFELKLIIYIGNHPNIVQFIGACTQQIRSRNLFVLLEFCPNGNLLDFLKEKRNDFQNLVIEDIIHYENVQRIDNRSPLPPCSTKELVQFCLNIIHALEYLKQKQVIHGDIAARNILLDQNMKAKLSDFGLSRVLLKCGNYVKRTREPLPWRYMAIESLESNTFSFQSDIWAFGVTMWEIFTLGLVPYSSLNHSPEFVQYIANGLRLPKPEFATTAIHEQILLECWKKNPEERLGLDKMKTYFYNLSSSLEPELEEHYVTL